MIEFFSKKLRSIFKPGFTIDKEPKVLQYPFYKKWKWPLIVFLVIIYYIFTPFSVDQPRFTLIRPQKINSTYPSITNNPIFVYATPSFNYEEELYPNEKPPPSDLQKKPTARSIINAEILDNQLLYLPIVSKIDASENAGLNSYVKEFYGINFENGARRITIEIHPNSKKFNGGRPIRISFLPGDHCEFGDNHACVFSFRNGFGSNVIFLTIHSGVTGEAQQFRHSIEGTGLNRAGFAIEKVKRNLEILHNSDVKLIQGKLKGGGLHISDISRIPAGKVHDYFQVPLEETLSFSFDQNPQINKTMYVNKPLIVIETCGWKMPGEPWAKDITSTTGSIYLAIITETE